MHKFIFFLLLLFLANCGNTGDSAQSGQQGPPKYDAELAARLGADEYGMHRYVVAFLKSGPNQSQDSLAAMQLQKAHLKNINRLAEEGRLVLAGPFLDGGGLRGIYVFDVETTEEARALTATDPAIQTGRLVMELHPWYGSAGLMQMYELHKRLARSDVAE